MKKRRVIWSLTAVFALLILVLPDSVMAHHMSPYTYYSDIGNLNEEMVHNGVNDETMLGTGMSDQNGSDMTFDTSANGALNGTNTMMNDDDFVTGAVDNGQLSQNGADYGEEDHEFINGAADNGALTGIEDGPGATIPEPAQTQEAAKQGVPDVPVPQGGK
jgi:hypothetical protein